MNRLTYCSALLASLAFSLREVSHRCFEMFVFLYALYSGFSAWFCESISSNFVGFGFTPCPQKYFFFCDFKNCYRQKNVFVSMLEFLLTTT